MIEKESIKEKLIIDQEYHSNISEQQLDALHKGIRKHDADRSPAEKMRSAIFAERLRMRKFLDNPFTEFGELSLAFWLKKYMEAAQISQTELANALGLSRSYINNILAGRQRIGESFAIRMEIHSGIPAQYWFRLQQRIDLATRLDNPELRRELEQKVKRLSALS